MKKILRRWILKYHLFWYRKKYTDENDYKILLAYMQLPISSMFDDYTPRKGLERSLMVVHHRCIDLIDVIEECSVFIGIKQPLPGKASRNSKFIKRILLDDYLADDKERPVDIVEFNKKLHDSVTRLCTTLEAVATNDPDYHKSYCRKLTYVFQDITRAQEALVNLALE